MARAVVWQAPLPGPFNEGGVRRGGCPRVRGRGAAGPPGALGRKLARAAPGGHGAPRPQHTPARAGFEPGRLLHCPAATHAPDPEEPE